MSETATRSAANALTYLESHNVASLASVGPDGPWAAAVFYVNDGFDLYFLSAAHTRHAQNIAADPRVAATVQEDYRRWPEIKGIQLEGDAREVLGTQRAEAIARYGLKFPFVADLAQAPVAIARAMQAVSWYRIVPARLYYIDNSRGLGHRDEIVRAGGVQGPSRQGANDAKDAKGKKS